MTFRYQQRRADVQAAARLVSSRVRWYFLILWLLLTALSLRNIYAALAYPEPEFSRGIRLFSALVPIVFAGILFLLFIWLHPYLTARRAVLRTVEWTVTGDGIHIATDVSDGNISWQAFIKFRENKNVMLLYVQKSQAQFIPKRILSDSQQNELRTLIQGHIKN